MRASLKFFTAPATVAALTVALWSAAGAHDIYTGVRSPKTGNLCCGGQDCSLTTYRERGGEFDFLTREGHWVRIDVESIIFLSIPGDPPHDDAKAAHLCYRPATDSDAMSMSDRVKSGEGQSIFLYCAFIPPGAI